VLQEYINQVESALLIIFTATVYQGAALTIIARVEEWAAMTRIFHPKLHELNSIFRYHFQSIILNAASYEELTAHVLRRTVTNEADSEDPSPPCLCPV
jgi:hypothetical protein